MYRGEAGDHGIPELDGESPGGGGGDEGGGGGGGGGGGPPAARRGSLPGRGPTFSVMCGRCRPRWPCCGVERGASETSLASSDSTIPRLRRPWDDAGGTRDEGAGASRRDEGGGARREEMAGPEPAGPERGTRERDVGGAAVEAPRPEAARVRDRVCIGSSFGSGGTAPLRGASEFIARKPDVFGVPSDCDQGGREAAGGTVSCRCLRGPPNRALSTEAPGCAASEKRPEP